MHNTHTLVSVSKTHQLYNYAWAFLNELTIKSCIPKVLAEKTV